MALLEIGIIFHLIKMQCELDPWLTLGYSSILGPLGLGVQQEMVGMEEKALQGLAQ